MKRKVSRKTKYFRQKMKPADYYGNCPIRTKYEYMAQGFLEEVGIPYHINQVFCFSCNKFYPFESFEMPSRCGLCNISFQGIDKGCISRPDFILDLDCYDEHNGILNFKKIAVLRIDGAVHDRIKSTRISDYHILQSFRDRGIKVFIIRNETFVEKTVKELRDIFTDIKLMMENDALYEKYINTNEYIEMTYCPDIQGKRYNKKASR